MNTCIPKEIATRLRISIENGEMDANAIAKLLPEEKVALRSILEDTVSEGLGVGVSPRELKIISEKSRVIDKAQKVLGEDVGNPLKIQENIEFFKAKKDMDSYLQGLTPSSKLKVMTGTVGRGAMLASVKSPLLNIASNTEIGFSEALARRISRFQIRGTDNTLAIKYVKMVNKIYQETGYDVSRMTTLHDLGSSGQRVLGKVVHSQGEGKVRALGRVVEDTVFKQLMGAPDVAFSSAHFADSVNLGARRLAKKEGLNAREIMNDAMRLDPKTDAGKILRQQGILDAQKATWTNTTWASKTSEGIRKILNEVSGDLRVGDYLLPFVKTPANVIATGMDYAGMGIPKTLFNAVKAIRTGGVKEIATREFAQKIAPDLVRSGLGLTAAAIIAHNLTTDDFIGAYDPNRKQIEELRNSNTNAIRVGGKWISTDYFGPLAVPLSAIMYAKKYGKTPGETTFQYGKGVLSQVYNLPGISDAIDYIKEKSNQPQNQTLAEAVQSTQDYILNQAASRLIPSIIPDVAKVFDPLERRPKGVIQVVKNKIPGLRNKLPVKVDIFGKEVKGESPLNELLFGSRVKTNRSNPIIEELSRVSNNTGKSMNFTNWDTSSNKELAQFKQAVGKDEYDRAKVEYGRDLQSLLDELTRTKKYQEANDTERAAMITGQDSSAIDKVFKSHKFKYKKGQSGIDVILSSYDKGDYESSKEAPKNILQRINSYGTAFYQDPGGAWKAITTRERLKKVISNPQGFNKGVVVLERKQALGGADEDNKSTQIDHILANVLGGTNEAKNLQALPVSENSLKGILEKYLAEQIEKGNLTREQARDIDRNWRDNLYRVGK